MSETSVVAEFRWIEAGRGLPVLCLHGLFGTSEHFAATVEALAPRWRAMALALPIFETPPDDLSVMSLRAHVEAFMDAERIPPAVIVGNSLGGHIALDLALHAPERVRALVLSGSSGLFERSFTRGVPHRPSAEFVRGKMTEVFHDPSIVTPEWVEAIRDRIEPAELRAPGAPGDPLGAALQPRGPALLRSSAPLSWCGARKTGSRPGTSPSGSSTACRPRRSGSFLTADTPR